VGTPLLLGPQERIMVNRVGDAVQLVRFGPDFRALAEPVPPEDAADVDGWVRTAERIWGLSGYIWHFQERGRGLEPQMNTDEHG
jgi:hypothetical protein